MESRGYMPPYGWSSVGREPRGKIVIILGPTASGKSDIAIKLARKFNGEIISADSRQIYRGMDLGTGKIRGAWSAKRGAFISAGIPHHMIDIVSPKTNYNAAKFKKQADKIIQDILQRGKLPILCGGTGFWIKAVVNEVNFPDVKPNQVLRNKLRNKTASSLFAMLTKLDPERAKTIEPQNKVRLIRAIEICKAIGKVPTIAEQRSDLSRPQRPKEVGPLKFLQIGIDIPKNILHKRIKTRLEKRFRQGMIKEVRDLHFKQKISWKKLESFGLEYRWIAKFLQNRISREEMVEKLYYDIIHYAKRQMTWFSKDKRIKWLKSYLDIQKEVNCFIK